ncbi:MAG: response regulator transcription factor [Clostridiales bacterium]|nr:response regulator transcription factor [Clostridiales bacterium]
MDKKRVLIIDDDEDLSFIMSEMLTSYGYEVTCANTCDQAFFELTDQIFHVILLDINLPEMTGFEVCKEIRKVSTVPIIFASARTSENDRITGLDLGGDDYLAKPYSMKELLAHINAVIRRTYGFTAHEKVVTFGGVAINLTARTVTKEGKPVSLSLREFDLIAYLAEHKNQAIAKDQLLHEVWGTFSEVEPSTLTVHIRWLREKLEMDPGKPKWIKTVWGMGYMLEVPDEA